MQDYSTATSQIRYCSLQWYMLKLSCATAKLKFNGGTKNNLQTCIEGQHLHDDDDDDDDDEIIKKNMLGGQ